LQLVSESKEVSDMGKRLGLLRAIYLVSASCMGSFAFAFDTGVISALLPIKETKKKRRAN
jgi:hypothetical protein